MWKVWAWIAVGWAQALTGDLVVVSETGEPFRLYLNGEWIAESPVTRAEAQDIPEGPQKVTLYIHPTEGRVIQLRKTVYVERDYVEYYAIRKRKGQYALTLFNRVPRAEVPPTPLPQPPSQPPAAPPAAGAPSQSQNTTIVFNPTIQVQTGGGTQINAPTSPQPGTGTPLPPGASSGYTGPCNCPYPTASATVQELLSTLRRESFDDTKLEIAKSFVQQNCLWSRDVRSLLEVFSFEENKLALAKFAYASVHDVAAYATVADAFTFSTNKEELMRYIRSQPARQQCYGHAAGTFPPAGAPNAPSSGGGAALPPCQPCMNASSFSQALASVRNTSSEAARLQVARQIAATNCLSAQQVQQLCRAFTSEENRLSFAKEAFLRCCDRENYFAVHEAFVSNASREALSQYIQSLTRR